MKKNASLSGFVRFRQNVYGDSGAGMRYRIHFRCMCWVISLNRTFEGPYVQNTFYAGVGPFMLNAHFGGTSFEECLDFFCTYLKFQNRQIYKGNYFQ